MKSMTQKTTSTSTNFEPQVIIVSEAYVGGVRTHINTLVNGLLEANINTKLLCSNREESLDSIGSNILGISSNLTPISGNSLITKLIFAWRLLIESSKWNPDSIVHAHGFIATLLLVLLKRMGLKNPLLVTLHGGILHKDGLSRSIVRKAIEWLVLPIHSFICVSEHDRDLHIKLGIPVEKLTIIQNAIDIKRIAHFVSSQSNPYGNGLINLGIVSTLYPTKGIVEFLVALNQAPIFDPQIYRITIVGTGPLKHQIQGIVNGSDYLKRLVHLVGHVAVPYNYIHWADVILFPSRKETFGLVLHEALYLGVPIVAHSQPTVAQHLAEDNIVNFSDVKIVKAAVDRLLKQPRCNQKNSYEQAYEQFIQNHEMIYRRFMTPAETPKTYRSSNIPLAPSSLKRTAISKSQ